MMCTQWVYGTVVDCDGMCEQVPVYCILTLWEAFKGKLLKKLQIKIYKIFNKKQPNKLQNIYWPIFYIR